MTRRRGRFHSKKSPLYLEEIFQDVDVPGTLYTKEERGKSDLFLGLYKKDDMMDLLSQAGILDILYGKGYRNLIVTVSRSETYISRLYVNFDRLDKGTRLIELLVRESLFKPKKTFVKNIDLSKGFSTLTIEWLSLQSPKESFSKDKPRLPSQIHPGLGGLRNIQEMLFTLTSSIEREAILDIPEHYHGAVIYSKIYSFFSPIDGGKLRAMMRDFKDSPLADVSYAVSYGCLINKMTGEHELMRPSEQVYPISKRLQEYVTCSEYQKILEESARSVKYAIDWEKYQTLLKEGVFDEV